MQQLMNQGFMNQNMPHSQLNAPIQAQQNVQPQALQAAMQVLGQFIMQFQQPATPQFF
jgi:hypothetical protein